MKKIIKLYLRQHSILLFAVLFSGLGISGSLAVLERNFDFLYLGILYLFIFSSFMGVHFYKNVPFYKAVLEDVSSEMDFIVLGNSPLAKAERERMQKIRRIYLETARNLQNENKNYKILINKWVHQMKTPLSVLHMLAQEEQKSTSQILENEVNRMNELLNQILHLLRMEHIENDFIVERCLLSDVVKCAINEQKNYFIQNEVYPKMDIPSGIWVYTDRKWFSFAIQQFLNNAVKYSEAGSHILVSAAAFETANVILQIQDFGTGILPEEQPRIFEFCYTGSNGRKKQKESSGLGLYIAKSILDYLGHDIEVLSTPGNGTIFKIHLNTET